MNPLEYAELLAIVVFVVVAMAADVTAIVRREKPLRLLWISGFLLLASMAVAAGKAELPTALVRLFRG